MRRFPAWLLLLPVVASCSCDKILPDARCEKDADCVEGRTCVDGTCQSGVAHVEDVDGGQAGGPSSRAVTSGTAGSSSRGAGSSRGATSFRPGSSGAVSSTASSAGATSASAGATTSSRSTSGSTGGATSVATVSSGARASSAAAATSVAASRASSSTTSSSSPSSSSAAVSVDTGPYTYTAWVTGTCTAAGCPQTRTESCTHAVCTNPQPISQTVTSYVATWTCTYDAAWTCTATGATGCLKNRTGCTATSWKDTGPDAAQDAATIYTTGYIATGTCASWGGCVANNGVCRAGKEACNSISATSWKATSPSITIADQDCNVPCNWGCWQSWRQGEYCPTAYPDSGACCGSAPFCSWNAADSCPHPGNCPGQCSKTDACGNPCNCDNC